MNKVLIAAMSSDSGKTAVTCGLLAVLQKRGLTPCAFKCGPDYIDPMFHRSVLGVESHNLDLFLADEKTVRKNFLKYSSGYDAVVCEGVMGYYDGLIGMTTYASSFHVAEILHLPVLLVVRPKGNSLTLAAQIKGLCDFRTPHHIMGILLNECTEERYKALAPLLEQETGIPVLGYLPHMQEAALKSRHLGLYTAAEIHDLQKRIAVLAEQFEKSVEVERLLALCSFSEKSVRREEKEEPKTVRLAVAQDAAFCFLYTETIDALRAAGAEIVFFSPLRDMFLPKDIDGLYLPGGYPELYAEELSANEAMRTEIKKYMENGLPIVAECGGFLYLCRSLEDTKGRSYPMVGGLPANGIRTDKLQHFGYAKLTAEKDSLLFRKGEAVPIHEFHYWNTDVSGEAFLAEKPVSGRKWQGGFGGETFYAAFPHLYFAGNERLTMRLIDGMKKYRQKRINNEKV